MKPHRLEDVLARRLREAAGARGIPLSHLADRAGVARSYLWLLLDAKSSATLDAVQRLAAVLEIDPVSLVTEGARFAPAAAESKRRPYALAENPTTRKRKH